MANGGNLNSSVSINVFKIVAELVLTPCSTSTQTQVPLLRKTHTVEKQKQSENTVIVINLETKLDSLTLTVRNPGRREFI